MPPPTSQTSAIVVRRSRRSIGRRACARPSTRRRRRSVPRAASACDELRRPRRFDGQLARLFVEGRRHGEHDRCRSSRRPRRRRPRSSRSTRRGCASDSAPTHRPARSAEPSRCCPTAGIAACRSTPGWASHDFAEATWRAGASAPRSRASTPAMASGVGSHGSATPPLAISCGFGKIEERRQQGRAARRSPARSAAECGTRVDPRVAAAACRRRRRRSWWCRDRCRSRNGVGRHVTSDRAFADVQFQLPPLVAVPLVAPELERADLGDAALERHRRDDRPSRRPPVRPVSVTSSGPSSSRSSPQSSMSVAGRIALADRRAEEPELRRLADGRGRTRGRRSRRSCPLPCRTARRRAP